MNERWKTAVHTLEERFWIAGKAAKFSQNAGLSEQQQQAIGIVAAELISNAIKYASGGWVTLDTISGEASRTGVLLEVEDQGPGIFALQEALQDGVSEGRMLTPDTPKNERRGLGVGLGAVLRLADEVTVTTEEHKGTKVRAIFWRKKGNGT